MQSTEYFITENVIFINNVNVCLFATTNISKFCKPILWFIFINKNGNVEGWLYTVVGNLIRGITDLRIIVFVFLRRSVLALDLILLFIFWRLCLLSMINEQWQKKKREKRKIIATISVWNFYLLPMIEVKSRVCFEN